MKKKTKAISNSEKWIFIVIVALITTFALTGCSSDNTNTNGNQVTEITPAKPETEDNSTDAVVSHISDSTLPEEISTPESETDIDSSATTSQNNALESAKTYLDFSSFSYDGLIEQLEYEEYSHEDAVYAADHCGADWNEQALISAKSYLDFSSFSYTGLVNKLEYDKFTNEQAIYAVDNCGADWNEQAARSAKSYLDISSFSRDSLIEQLEFEDFTPEEAEYGAKANGY